MKNNIKIREKEQDFIVNQINKHKKALIFVFFDDLIKQGFEIKKLEGVLDRGKNQKVMIIFQNGCKLIYQEEPLNLEQGVNKYFAWINKNIMYDKKLYYKKILQYPECGFLEYIKSHKYENIKQRKDFYYRVGGIMALIASLGGEIITKSDVIEAGDQPVLNDLSCLIKKEVKFCENMAEYKELKCEKKWVCDMENQIEIERGYNLIYNFIKNNKEDVRAAVKLFVLGK